MRDDDLSEWMFTALETDPRFATLDPAAAVVWIKLVRFWFGRGPMRDWALGWHPGDPEPWADLALAFRIPEADLHAHLEALFARRLLLRSDAGGFLVSGPSGDFGRPAGPFAPAPSEKAKAARLNGRLGGRPRKVAAPGETGGNPARAPEGGSTH